MISQILNKENIVLSIYIIDEQSCHYIQIGEYFIFEFETHT